MENGCRPSASFLVGWAIGSAIGRAVAQNNTGSDVPRKRWQYRDCSNNTLHYSDTPIMIQCHYEYRYYPR